MRKQTVHQAFENKSMEVALEALGESVAQWAVEGVWLVPDSE
jgi:hypothetical protein